MKLKNNSGVIIIVMISVISLLLILGLGFIVRIRLESKSVGSFINNLKAQYIAESGVNHAKRELIFDKFGNDNIADYNDVDERGKRIGDECYDWLGDEFYKFFSGNDADVNEDGINDSRWFVLEDSSGRNIGRYAVLIEDELSKININIASVYSADGVSPYEISLKKFFELLEISDPNNTASAILDYRYGDDQSAGRKDFDDDYDNNMLSSDFKDNDADGFVDELLEGVDELDENLYLMSKGDDRIYEHINQIKLACPSMQEADFHKIKDFLTVSSFYNNVDSNGKDRVDINTTNDVYGLYNLFRSKGINSAGKKVVNLIDYRDKNNIVSSIITLDGSFYGQESLVINEVLLDSQTDIRADFSGVDKTQVDEWNYDQGKYFVQGSFASDTWIFKGLAVNTNYKVIVYSNVPGSDGYFVNNKKIDVFDEQGKSEIGVFKTDENGEIEITCKDDGDQEPSYFEGAQFVSCEFIELYNAGLSEIDIYDCYFEVDMLGNAKEIYKISDNFESEDCVIGKNEYIIFTNDKELFDLNYGQDALIIEIPNFILRNCSGSIALKNNKNELLSITKNLAKGGVCGVSMERNDPFYDFYAGNLFFYATPGAQNSVYSEYQASR
ncbi:hypothetical protein KKC59_02685, partial [bacterium]|nr:hypothetical protein [bacterium]